MGAYVYRVKTKPRNVAGQLIHESVFAYKPWGRAIDDELDRKHVAPARRAWNRKSDEARHGALVVVGKVSHNQPIFRLKYVTGAFLDDDLTAKAEVVGYIVNRKGRYRVVDFEEINRKVRENTAFPSMDDMLNAGGNYRPSIDMREPVMAEIADEYDRRQEQRGDPRRAYRYGNGH